ncbi:MAG: hypothetical protein R3255_11135 [Candidatus Lokiarchaeia archaeon]|nr:hypothetical protein [Candidatus Lokiarchaeia archaeon]
MDPKDTEKEIEKLSSMLSKIQNIYYKKKEDLEELKLEINELRDVLNVLNTLVSGKSFQSADEIYSKALAKKTDLQNDDEYFVEEISREKVEGTNIKRKIFSKNKDNDEELLCVLNFYDFNRVEIKFIDPEKRKVRETSEDFIQIFLKGALIKIKENNPQLSVDYDYFRKTGFIEKMSIKGLKSIKDYDIITSKMRELLAKEISLNS